MSGSRIHEDAGVAELPLTHWSAVFAAGREGTARAEAALAELCRAYWFPLYAFAYHA